MFVSGHSLIDRPTPDYLERIAASLATPMEWNSQHIGGSSIRRRTRGEDLNGKGWEGYREGQSKTGETIDVIRELAHPQTVGGKYDILLLTEQHGMLETLVWNDTVRYLRHFHDRHIAGNPDGVTYFYESWISVDDKSDPARWIAYEKMASPIWQCMATRINASLETEGRRDRIVSLPAGIALADLIEKATSAAGLQGISADSTRATVDRLLEDVVHPTRLTNYYLALVTYASIFRHSPEGAWFPENEVSPQQAQLLQRLAADFVARYYASYRPLSLRECRERIEDGVINEYWTYVRDTYWVPDVGTIQAYTRWARMLFEWRRTLTRDDDRNPFFFDPAEQDYWLPAPDEQTSNNGARVNGGE